MKKTACFIALVAAASFSSVTMARNMPTNDNVPQCKVELKRANGHKVTAYLLRSDCEKLSHMKKGESVRMAGFVNIAADIGSALAR